MGLFHIIKHPKGRTRAYFCGIKIASWNHEKHKRRYTPNELPDPHFYEMNDPRPSSVKLDILIPAIKKDIAVLPEVLNSLRSNLLHPIGTIFIVAPIGLEAFCKHHGVIFLNEDTVLP